MGASFVPTPLGSKVKQDQRKEEDPNWFEKTFFGRSTGPRRDLYQGNEWDRPLHDDEWRILYYPLREMAFLIDFILDVGKRYYEKKEKNESVDRVRYRGHDKPRNQCLRPLASIYVTVRCILALIFLYYAIPWFLCEITNIV